MTQEDPMILKIDIEKLSEILSSVKRNYEDDNILINLGPSGHGYAIHPRIEGELREEFNLDEDDFSKLINDIMFIVASIALNKEERVFDKYGETKEIMSILSKFKLELRNLVESLRFKAFCKTQFLEDFSWDISIRVRQSGGIKIQFPLSVIKMSFSKTGFPFSSILDEKNSITFECTLQDIEKMIKSLEEIKDALTELQEEG